MSNERVLEARLRTQLSRWAVHTFPATDVTNASTDLPGTMPLVAMPEPIAVDRARRSATRSVLVAALVVVALAAGAVGIVNARRSSTPATRADQATLVRVEWRFVSFVVDGQRVSVPTDTYWALRFDGAGHFSGTACNSFSGAVTIRSDTLAFGKEQGQTSMRCTREIDRRIEDAVARLRYAAPTWSVENDVLRLTIPGVAAELTRAVSVFPTLDLVVLASSERDRTPGQWQFGYQAKFPQYLYWEGRSEPGTAFGNVGVRVEPSKVWATAVSVGSGHVVIGSVPDATASAKYVADSTPDLELTLYTVPGGHLAFAQSVNVGGGDVVAYDASGHEVGRTQVLPG